MYVIYALFTLYWIFDFPSNKEMKPVEIIPETWPIICQYGVWEKSRGEEV